MKELLLIRAGSERSLFLRSVEERDREQLIKKIASHKQYDRLELAPNAFSDVKLEIQTGEVIQ